MKASLTIEGARFIKKLMIPALKNGEVIPAGIPFVMHRGKLTNKDKEWAQSELKRLKII